ncbi:MAG: hypothetical protein C0509_07970, partial [Acinetobacter sp.]|nr:hypothetical protein [Acinetobacter sp.]
HRLKTAPVQEPVTLEEVRRALGNFDVSETTRDGIITARITAARQWCEDYTRTGFITQTWMAYGSEFGCAVIELRPPLQSVVSVKYVDTNGILQTLSPSTYLVDTVNHAIHASPNAVWPTTLDRYDSVQIEYVAGYGNAGQVPEPIKEAIKFIVGQWEGFQATIEAGLRPQTVPWAAMQLLNYYRDYRGGY